MLERMGRAAEPQERGTYPAIKGQQDGITLDIPVDDTLGMQVSQGLKHSFAHGGNLLLIQPGQGRQATNGRVVRVAGLGREESQAKGPTTPRQHIHAG